MTRAFNWAGIRALYESGTTAYQLAKIPGNPSKQAIAKRAKKEGWTVGNRPSYPVAQVTEAGAVVSPPANSSSAKGRVLAQLAEGATFKLAAACVGISDRTLRHWREDDAAFAAVCENAQAAAALKRLKRIDAAAERGDWHADKWRLERDPYTREDFAPPNKGDRSSGGPCVVIFSRTGGRDVIDVRSSQVIEHIPDPEPAGYVPYAPSSQTLSIAPPADEKPKSPLRVDPLGRDR